MQNVLIFPKHKQSKKSLFKRIANFIENCKIRKEKSFQEKIEFLKSECYDVYLKQILKQRKQEGIPDFPEWMYTRRYIVCVEAMNKSIQAVKETFMKYGREHIERCYKNRVKHLKRK